MERTNKRTLLDKWLENMGWVALFMMILLPIYYYGDLPNTIPTHFNAKGEPDAFDSKMYIWMLPVIGTILYLTLHFVGKKSDSFNHRSLKIKAENKPIVNYHSQQMLRALNTFLVISLCYLTYLNIQVASGNANGLGVIFLPIFLGGVFGIMGFYLYKIWKYI